MPTDCPDVENDEPARPKPHVDHTELDSSELPQNESSELAAAHPKMQQTNTAQKDIIGSPSKPPGYSGSTPGAAKTPYHGLRFTPPSAYGKFVRQMAAEQRAQYGSNSRFQEEVTPTADRTRRTRDPSRIEEVMSEPGKRRSRDQPPTQAESNRTGKADTPPRFDTAW